MVMLTLSPRGMTNIMVMLTEPQRVDKHHGIVDSEPQGGGGEVTYIVVMLPLNPRGGR